jgi:transcriptional regulator with XRE-family HTH domain
VLQPTVGATLNGPLIARLREARGMTQLALALRAGVSPGRIAQIEQGRVPDPRLSTLIGIARALHIPVGQLVGELLEEEAPTKEATG